MSFAWPVLLLVTLAAPILIGLHAWQLRRRRRTAVRVPSVALIRESVPRRSRWRRHVPVALLAAALVILGVAAARPMASVPVPVNSTSMILALDTSGSMCNTDIAPNRLSAAQQASTQFVDQQTGDGRIGLVTFNGVAALVVPTTSDADVLRKAIANLSVARGTAIGLAILSAVDAIAEINRDVPSTSVELGPPAVDPSSEESTKYQPDIIVVLTDGANTRGVDPLVAAEVAAARGIRVYTIGFGTTQPETLVCTPDQVVGGYEFQGFGGGPGQGFDQGGGGGGGNFLQIDEPTLQGIAAMTGGEYYLAQDAEELIDVFRQLPSRIVMQDEDVELTALFAIAGALLAVAAVGLAIRWTRVG